MKRNVMLFFAFAFIVLIGCACDLVTKDEQINLHHAVDKVIIKDVSQFKAVWSVASDLEKATILDSCNSLSSNREFGIIILNEYVDCKSKDLSKKLEEKIVFDLWMNSELESFFFRNKKLNNKPIDELLKNERIKFVYFIFATKSFDRLFEVRDVIGVDCTNLVDSIIIGDFNDSTKTLCGIYQKIPALKKSTIQEGNNSDKRFVVMTNIANLEITYLSCLKTILCSSSKSEFDDLWRKTYALRDLIGMKINGTLINSK